MPVGGGADGPRRGILPGQSFRGYYSRDKHISRQWSYGLLLLPDYGGEKKRKLPGGHGSEWSHLPSVFPPYVDIKLLELMLSTPLTSSQAEAPPQGSSVATDDEPLKFTRVLMSPYPSLISVAE